MPKLNRWQTRHIEFCATFFSAMRTSGSVACAAAILIFIALLFCMWIYDASNPVSDFLYLSFGGRAFEASPTTYSISLIIACFVISGGIAICCEAFEMPFAAESSLRDAKGRLPNYYGAVLTRKPGEKTSGYELQDLYDQQNKSTELTTGIHHYFRLNYARAAFTGSIEAVQLGVDRKLDLSADSEIYETISGFGSLSPHQVGSTAYHKKYHSTEVPTLSRFGYRKTPIVALQILRHRDQSKKGTSYKLRKYLSDTSEGGYAAMASIQLVLHLPHEQFDLVLQSVESQNIHNLKLNCNLPKNGIYRKTIETRHFKVLFEDDPVRFAENFGDIFDNREMNEEEKGELSFADELLNKVHFDELELSLSTKTVGLIQRTHV